MAPINVFGRRKLVPDIQAAMLSRRPGRHGLVTNLLTYSEQFDNAAWTKTRASVTANAAVAPDGTMTADKLVEDTTASNTHFVGQAFTAVSGTTYCSSWFLKVVERSRVTLLLPSEQFGTTQSVQFNLTSKTGTIASGAPLYGVVDCGNGWVRIWISAQATVSATSNGYCYLTDGSGNATYTGDGTSGLYIWGAMLNVGSEPGPYTRTEGSVVTQPY